MLQLEWKPLSDTDVLPEYGDDGVVVALVHSESNKDIAQDGIADDDDAENGNDNDEYSAAQIDPMTSVLNAMGAHGSHAGVQQQGCRALWMMCKSGGIEMKQKMLDAGAHEYAVRAMRMYKGDIHITHYCIGFCQSLAAYAPARPALISMNVHTLVNRAMRAFFESPSLQMQSLVCLRNLALEPSARIMFMPILETICSVMNKHKADPGVQECGCACMSVLSLERTCLLFMSFIDSCVSKCITTFETHRTAHFLVQYSSLPTNNQRKTEGFCLCNCCFITML